MKLNNIFQLEGQIELVSGLHIGAGSGEIRIGGIDSSVLKHPHTDEPFIPGSSLKGKMRSLLEWRAGVVADTDGKPVDGKTLGKLTGQKLEGAEAIARLFGLSGDANNTALVETVGPTRLAFCDCSISSGWRKSLPETAMLTEAKSENFINRITGTAEHPRQIERVPAGATFDFRLSWKVLEGDPDWLTWVLDGLKLLELDSIGGSGSRGYGKIRFTGLSLNGASVQQQLDDAKPFGV